MQLLVCHIGLREAPGVTKTKNILWSDGLQLSGGNISSLILMSETSHSDTWTQAMQQQRDEIASWSIYRHVTLQNHKWIREDQCLLQNQCVYQMAEFLCVDLVSFRNAAPPGNSTDVRMKVEALKISASGGIHSTSCLFSLRWGCGLWRRVVIARLGPHSSEGSLRGYVLHCICCLFVFNKKENSHSETAHFSSLLIFIAWFPALLSLLPQTILRRVPRL